MKLLIVDDQISVVQGLLHCTDWAQQGFDRVDTAYNAIDAKANLLREEAQVMLCDIEMPVESGLDLLKWVRAQEMHTRCIFLTAHAKFQYAQEACRLGGFDYIMQPAPYEQVVETVARAMQDVRMEQASQKLQDRGILFEGHQKAITVNLVRDCLAGTASESGLASFEALGLYPQQGRVCRLILLQPLRWQKGVQPWDLSLLNSAADNLFGEVFPPPEYFSLTIPMPQEQAIAVLLQSRADTPLPADALRGQIAYLQSAFSQYLHLTTAFYIAGPEKFSRAGELWRALLEQRSENVALKSGIFLARNRQTEEPEVTHFPQIAGWRRLIRDNYVSAMEQEAFALLDRLAEQDRLSRAVLNTFYHEYLDMTFSLRETDPERVQRVFRDAALQELIHGGVRTVDDMKSLIHAFSSAWSGGRNAEDRDVVEVICRYIAEHLENELRRDELAEAVHLNPDYMARLFKKETGINLKDYIIQQKMQEARSLLQTTNLPVSFIAAKVGYSNFAHFSASYKKLFNRSPQEERQNP